MNSALLEYLTVQEELLRLRALGFVSRDTEDEYADQLEPLWWKLTPDERREAEQYFAAPEIVDEHALDNLEDVEDFQHVFPRRKAA